MEKILKTTCLNNDHYDGPSVFGHLMNTGTIARAIAPQVGANPCVCHLGGLLHDIGSISNGRDEHHIVGAGMAVRILRHLGIKDELLIDAVRRCVLYHRSSVEVDGLTIEEKVVRTADALSHYLRADHLWQEGARKVMTPDETKSWLTKKFEKDWEKVIPQIQVPATGQKPQEPSATELYEQALAKLDALYAEASGDATLQTLLDIALQISQAD